MGWSSGRCCGIIFHNENVLRTHATRRQFVFLCQEGNDFLLNHGVDVVSDRSHWFVREVYRWKTLSSERMMGAQSNRGLPLSTHINSERRNAWENCVLMTKYSCKHTSEWRNIYLMSIRCPTADELAVLFSFSDPSRTAIIFNHLGCNVYIKQFWVAWR